MRIETRRPVGRSDLKNCETETSFLEALIKALNEFEPSTGASIPISKQIKSALDIFFKRHNAILDFQFCGALAHDFPKANYQVNYAVDIFDAGCGHEHRILAEMCFDNRQAIGTNLLKFQVSQFFCDEIINRDLLSIIICADRRSLIKYGWDGGVASSEEYEFAARNPYQNVIAKPPVLLVIRESD